MVTGNPLDASVTMGPLTTADQLSDDVGGIERLTAAARIVHGSGQRVDGVGADPGKGWFFGPTLLRADEARPSLGREQALANAPAREERGFLVPRVVSE